MAYPAVISLKQTISGLVNSSPAPLSSSTREILESAYNHTTSLLQVLQVLDYRSNTRSSERLAALNGEARDGAHELEDVLEFHDLREDFKVVRQAIASFGETVKKLEVEYFHELTKPFLDEDEDAASYPDFGVEMVGQSEKFQKIRESLLDRKMPYDTAFYLLLGYGGKIVAKTLFDDAGEFDSWAWVKVGAKYESKEVLTQILAQLGDDDDQDHNDNQNVNELELCNLLCQLLEQRKYMIVLDDVHDTHLVEIFRSSLPNRSDGSIVFLTSSSRELTRVSDYLLDLEMTLQFVQEYVWSILRMALFGAWPAPPEFEEAGKKILKNCRGSCISAAKTLLYLYKTEMTLTRWRKLAADEQNLIFLCGDEISEISTIRAMMQSCRWNLDNPVEKLIVQFISDWGYLDNIVNVVKMRMQPERFFSKMQVVSLLGMAGVGKSTLARKIFKDESIFRRFDHHVWITLGPKYQSKEVLVDVLSQIYPNIDKMQMKTDAESTRKLCVQLSNKRCFIVLDDLWSKDPLCHLRNVFPGIMGTTLLTTRLADVAEFGKEDIIQKINLLDKEESWCLFRRKVFGEGFCSFELEKAGRRIVESSEGLPLLILTVADQLLKVDKTPEYWNDVASGRDKSVFKNAHDEISKGLLPSYESLSENLKACFLYIGVFRNSYEIPIYKLTILWIAEGFLESDSAQMVEDFAAKCVSELAKRNLVMVYHSRVSDSLIKKSRQHPVFWHLSNSEAAKNKFFHAMNSYEDCFIESMSSNRRLCIRNNILLAIKDVSDLMESIKTTHSLLCVGPPHQYQVPINFNMRLLRVMDADTIRLYEFPVEVVKLVHLRYLGLMCNGNLPISISNLRKLQYLIVKRYMSFKSPKNSMPLPIEIWDMRELIHLQVMGGCLPNPKYGSGLPKLSTLLDLSVESCTKKVLKRLPNLKRLGIRIDLSPNDKGNPFRSLNRISRLHRLESLKCVVVNPQISSGAVSPPPPISMFPSCLKKLSLNGFGYPWEYMTIIGRLKNLEVLKLKHYAFRGPEWITDFYNMFKKLHFLLIDDTDLVRWEIKTIVLQELDRLSIKHCYKLQELPMHLSAENFTKIEIVDCNPSIATWAEQMRQVLEPRRYPPSEVELNLSWAGLQRIFQIN